MRRRRLRKEEPERLASELTPDERRRRVFQRAVKLLASRPHSINELREKLQRGRVASKTVVEEVVSRLQEYGYLDDERFALSYAALKVRQRPTGPRRLRQDLTLKKVDKSVVEKALDLVYSETPEEELIDQAIEKRVRLRGKPKTRLEAKSLFDHLLRQGFTFDLVADKVRSLSGSVASEE